MSKRSFHLRIENPCPANWDAMEPREQGRFCSECQKVVVDLTAVTQCEAERIVAAATQKLCIRMRVDSYGHPRFLERSRTALAAASLALAACGGSTQREVPTTETPPQTSGGVVAAPDSPPKPVDPPPAPTESCSSNCAPDEILPEDQEVFMGEAAEPLATPPAHAGSSPVLMGNMVNPSGSK